MEIERPPLWRPTREQRNAAAEVLMAALGDGRISLTEYVQRYDAVLAARDVPELDAAILDLGPERVPTGTAVVRRMFSVFGRHTRAGRWRLPDRLRVVTLLADTSLDLRDAYCSGETATIRGYGLLGDVHVVVPDGVDVELTGAHLVGNRMQQTAGPRVPGTPLVRVRITMLFGDVTVTSVRVTPPR